VPTAKHIAPQVGYLPVAIVNAYLVGEPDAWALVDTGIPHRFEWIKAACENRFGENARPEAILLTHGHFDHGGSALALASYWNVPIYVHPLEMPYVTGKSEYAPQDPTVGGAIAFASRFFPHTAADDLSNFVRPLPEDGSVPGLPGWTWHHTPGHTPGHVSFFREADRCLIAGDAFLTTDLDSWLDFLTKKPELARAPSPLTPDWTAARRSIEFLASLRPYTVACGHGIPMSGPHVAGALQAFAEDFVAPLHGRYVPEPAVANENGIVSVPPPVPDSLPKVAAGVGVAALLGAGIYAAAAGRRKNRKDD
jgi:glyoxylase-like metal-dependent hydrolase (beta-lactamase superfamily II)